MTNQAVILECVIKKEASEADVPSMEASHSVTNQAVKHQFNIKKEAYEADASNMEGIHSVTNKAVKHQLHIKKEASEGVVANTEGIQDAPDVNTCRSKGSGLCAATAIRKLEKEGRPRKIRSPKP